MRSTRSAITGLLLATILSAPAALAQNPTAPPATMHHGMMHQAGQSPDRVEQRIAYLHDKLQITPAEQELWDKFAKVMRDNAQQIRQSASERAAKLKDMNAADNMQSYAQLTMLHAQDLQNLTAAFQPLYASFSQDQQRIADTMFRNVAMHHVTRHRG